MILDNRAVLAFLSLSRTLSFTKTAVELSLTQPRLSYIIRRFESELGFDLFIRTTRRVELTAAGEQFREVALKVEASLQEADALVRQMRGESRVRLRVAAPIYTNRVAVRLQILGEFTAKHPRVVLEVSYGSTREKLNELRRGDVDVVFATDPPPLAGLESMVVARSTTCVVMPPNHRLAMMETVPIEALKGEVLVCMQRANLGKAYFERQYGPALRAGAELLEAPESDPYAQMHFTNARGAVLMSYRWQKGMDRAVGDMVTRPLVGGPPGCELHLVRRSTLHSLALEWFWAVGRAYELQPLPEAATGEAASADGQLRAGSGRRREALQLGGTPGRPIVKRG
ncbi:LysR family transcriptional regulator [Phenylobacterium sp. SCN 70-31]|uniref:LysR substrate-binding domain-containing protein n=1 Tax=Phenylobacterium sp. SCN 70-31 TaxID=1660129 RepID=UPI0008692038|nr:LysR family transcriptional regulator [Phenylobacterium sp. SCN 70-31]ODT88320.1 MAG: hypothetical protein ABS78_06765 [Phenylobacterium sp. SCN 70-31]